MKSAEEKSREIVTKMRGKFVNWETQEEFTGLITAALQSYEDRIAKLRDTLFEVAGQEHYEYLSSVARQALREDEGKCPPHSWDKSGERCTKCGDKDWM